MKDSIVQNLVYMTPKKERRLVALFSNGVWIEVYNGEVILVHKSRVYELSLNGLEVVQEGLYPTLYKTEAEAEEGLNNPYKVYRGV